MSKEMSKFEAYKQQYLDNWDSLKIRTGRAKEARDCANKLLHHKDLYQKIESRTGVPWWFVGLCHYREADCRLDRYLGNGQPLDKITTRVPKGRGPFLGPDAFVNGAIDALQLQHLVGSKDWSIARALYRLEGYNGFGYHYWDTNSPYLYGGSTAYGPPENKGGKYVSDDKFNPGVVDTQLGTAVILKTLMQLELSIEFDGADVSAGPEREELADPDDELAGDVLWVQKSLNKLGADSHVVEDGKIGPKTMTAISLFQRENGLPDTGLPDAETISAIERRMIAPAPAEERFEEVSGKPLAAADAPAEPLKSAGKIATPSATDAAAAEASAPEDATALLKGIYEIVSKTDTTKQTTPLAAVNGALGQTIGQLLNGHKTGIGIAGALATALLSNVPPASGLGNVLAQITPAIAAPAGFSGYAMPIFMALAAWGALGKLEKWQETEVQGSGRKPSK